MSTMRGGIHPKQGLWSAIGAKVPDVSAVFAWTQIAAAALFREAVRHGVRVSSGIMVATFDNPYSVAAQQDPFQMGTDRAKQLVVRLSHPDASWKTTLILPVNVSRYPSDGADPRIDGHVAGMSARHDRTGHRMMGRRDSTVATVSQKALEPQGVVT